LIDAHREPLMETTTTSKDFLSVLNFDAADLERALHLAAQLKADRSLGRHAPTADALNGRHVALLFDKPSLRTRTTFEIAVRELGGHLVAVQPDVALGHRVERRHYSLWAVLTHLFAKPGEDGQRLLHGRRDFFLFVGHVCPRRGRGEARVVGS
jgi:hypothetical protein